jgi:hypothetical protein
MFLNLNVNTFFGKIPMKINKTHMLKIPMQPGEQQNTQIAKKDAAKKGKGPP